MNTIDGGAAVQQSAVPLTALYVDFDNVYLGLEPQSRKAFGHHPERWLPLVETAGVGLLRVALRSVYLNPSPFQNFQEPFARAGFRVNSCPSITQQGKSGADLRLALDAVETLHSGAVRYEHFVLMSGDADFTHLANVLREAGRRVTVLSPMPVAAAYRHTADVVVAGPEFNTLLGLPGAAAGSAGKVEAVKVGRKSPPRRDQKQPAVNLGAQAVAEHVTASPGPVPSAAAAQVALRAEPGLRGGSWEGTGTFLTWVGANVDGVECTNRSGGWLWVEGVHDTSAIFSDEPAEAV